MAPFSGFVSLQARARLVKKWDALFIGVGCIGCTLYNGAVAMFDQRVQQTIRSSEGVVGDH